MGTEAIDGSDDWWSYDGNSCDWWSNCKRPFPRCGKAGARETREVSGSSAECANFPMVERVETESGFSGNWRDGKVQNLLAKLISSELSAHQMAPECESASALEPMGASSSADPLPRVPDSLLLYWTLVDQSVVPPGFEEAFACFSVQWSEAAARDDSRKSHWNNETVALSLAAQRKAQEESERLERHSKNQFLLAAIKPPSTYRTKFQKIAYEGATARKDAEDDERLRWLHILAGIVQNTETPMAAILRERSGDIRLLGAGKRATTLRASVAPPLRRLAVGSVWSLLPE